jgi:hypothetical protein
MRCSVGKNCPVIITSGLRLKGQKKELGEEQIGRGYSEKGYAEGINIQF